MFAKYNIHGLLVQTEVTINDNKNIDRFISGNSGIGSLILDPTQFTKTKFVEGKSGLARCVNAREFVHCSEISEGMYEVQSTPRHVSMNLPIQLGFFVLQYAKKRLLEFYYDFVDVYVDRSDYISLMADTDAYYAAFSAPSFRETVKPGMLEAYDKQVFGSCTNGSGHTSATTPFVVRECCEACHRWDKRECGVFKVEQTGNELIALCSKSYFLKHETGHKLSCAGVNKDSLDNPYDKFLSVLHDQAKVHVENVGLRAICHRIYAYKQRKVALNFMYTKRLVMDDFVSTMPLDVTLSPAKLVQCSMCGGFEGEFITTPTGGQFCHDCVQFIETCTYE